LDAGAGRLDVADVHKLRQRGNPQPAQGTAAGIERQVLLGFLVEPARRHHPGVLSLEIATLWLWYRSLVPWVPLINRIAERVLIDERLGILPVAIEGAAEQDAEAEVDFDQVRGDQVAINDNARSDIHGPAPFRHSRVGIIADVGVVERAPAAEQHATAAD